MKSLYREYEGVLPDSKKEEDDEVGVSHSCVFVVFFLLREVLFI